MTLNGVMAVILRYFAEIGTFGANYFIVIKLAHIFCNKTLAQRIYTFRQNMKYTPRGYWEKYVKDKVHRTRQQKNQCEWIVSVLKCSSVTD